MAGLGTTTPDFERHDLGPNQAIDDPILGHNQDGSWCFASSKKEESHGPVFTSFQQPRVRDSILT